LYFRFGQEDCAWLLKLLGIYEPETRSLLKTISDYHERGDTKLLEIIPDIAPLPSPGTPLDFADDDDSLLL
jgi:hypothetical protein